MSILHARCLRSFLALITDNCLIFCDLTDHLLKHLLCDRSRPKDHRRCHSHIKDRRFHSDLHTSSIDDHINLAIQIFLHMHRSCRTRAPGCICTRSRHISPACQNDRTRNLIRRHSDCYSIQSSGSSIWYQCTFFKNHRKRSWPEMIRQQCSLIWYIHRNLFQCPVFCNVNDQWIIRRSSLRRICFFCRLFLQRMCSESIYSLCRESYQSSLLQDDPCHSDHIFVNICSLYFFYYRFHAPYYSILLLKNKPLYKFKYSFNPSQTACAIFS